MKLKELFGNEKIVLETRDGALGIFWNKKIIFVYENRFKNTEIKTLLYENFYEDLKSKGYMIGDIVKIYCIKDIENFKIEEPNFELLELIFEYPKINSNTFKRGDKIKILNLGCIFEVLFSHIDDEYIYFLYEDSDVFENVDKGYKKVSKDKIIFDVEVEFK